ncbi:MAG: two-component regulator propeller domain-containing protein [Saprospiraceae bacterium]
MGDFFIHLPQFRVILFFLLGNATFVSGQSVGEIKFSTINKNNGLPANNISSIIKDDLGFIWIGTKNGLCRYESADNIKNFSHQSHYNKLYSSNIQVLETDRKGNLWIGTRLGGLTCYHPETEEWKSYTYDADDPSSLSDNEVLAITEDRKGRLWVGTENGLNIFDPKTEKFTVFQPKVGDSTALQTKAVLNILEDSQGRMWISTWAGGFYLALPAMNGDLDQMQFRQFFPAQDLQSHNVWKMYQDQQQRYWICTHGGGLFLMQLPATATTRRNAQNWQPTFHSYKADEDNLKSISSDAQQDILQDQMGRLWIGTTHGLNILESETLPTAKYLQPTEDAPVLKFKRYFSNSRNGSSLSHNIIIDLYEDNQGIVWISTFNGVSIFNWHNSQFKNYDFQMDDEVIISNGQNMCVLPDRKAWIGTGNHGVIYYDFQTEEKIYFNQANCNFLLDDYVSAVHSTDKEYLYFGSRKGLTIYHARTQKVEYYPLSQELMDQHPNFQIQDIYIDDYQRIWLSTGRGLFILDLVTKQYRAFMHQANVSNSISDNSVNGLLKDSRGYLWIATYNGLNRVDLRERNEDIIFEVFRHDPADPHHSLPSNQLVDIIEIDDKLYLGTASGIYYYDYKTRQFSKVNHPDNNLFIVSFEKNDQGELWASTMEGILCYNIADNKFQLFHKKNGIEDVSFRVLSSYKDEKGRLYFGNINGAVVFDPTQIARNTVVPPVYVTRIKKINAETGEEEISLIRQKELELNQDDYYISLYFAALNYNNPDKNKYAYQLEGFDKDWNYLSQNTAATYTNLAPGEYTFRIKASNNDGVWNNEGRALKIIRKPAIWETRWLYLLIFSVLLAVALAAVKLYVYQIRRRNLRTKNMLEGLVNQRTQQLEEKNEEVGNLLEKIKTRNEELEQIVSKRTVSLEQSNRELQQSNQELEQFAYVASHDMKEPLRIIGSFSGLLKRRLKQADKSTQEYLYYIEDGAKRMTSLINSLLAYSQLTKKGMTVEKTDLNYIIQTKLHDLSQVIQQKNVQIICDDLPEIYCESNQIGMVFFNLINNGIKFNQSEKPIINIEVHSDTAAGFWKFSVTDNGIGIAPEYQKRVFEIFRRLHSKQEYEGTGIGLALCQKIVQGHGGKIEIDSVLGEYTTFSFTIDKNLENLVVPEEKIEIADRVLSN